MVIPELESINISTSSRDSVHCTRLFLNPPLHITIHHPLHHHHHSCFIALISTCNCSILDCDVPIPSRTPLGFQCGWPSPLTSVHSDRQDVSSPQHEHTRICFWQTLSCWKLEDWKTWRGIFAEVKVIGISIRGVVLCNQVLQQAWATQNYG